MLRTRLVALFGLSLAGLAGLSIVIRPGLKAQQPPGVMALAFVGGAFSGPKTEDSPETPPVYLPPHPMTDAELKTRTKLRMKLAMNFPDGTPYEDFEKFIQEGTVDQADFPEGISIFHDADGFRFTPKDFTTKGAIHFKNIPLDTTLELVLKQFGLVYWVNKDGLLIITSTEDILTPSMVNREILTTLATLHAEVHSLREEVKALRRGDGEVPQAGGNLPARGPGGAGGGGFR